MQGQIETGSIVGTLTNNSNISGNINNPNDLTGLLNPITPQSVKDYNKLTNKPQINEIELQNNKNLEDLNVNKLTNKEIENIINSIV